ncbi:MAG: inositol monophosphatase family protein [Phycisphaerae bacterium]
MDAAQLREVLEFAVDAARAAGELTLRHFQANTAVEWKADRSPVTIADRDAEALLRERIEGAYPTHSIVGEEHGQKQGREPVRWILDPIDGTMSFICGVPLYSVLIGVEERGEMVAGVIHMPALRETVFAARGLGCFWNERPARVSTIDDLSLARIFNAPVKLMRRCGRGAAFDRLADACLADRGCVDGYGYALVATGRAEAVIDPIMNLWDTAAVVPCVVEAGGRVTDWNGVADHTRPEAVATNGQLHDAVLRALAGA